MKESQKYYAEQNKPDTNMCTPCASIYMKLKNRWSLPAAKEAEVAHDSTDCLKRDTSEFPRVQKYSGTCLFGCHMGVYICQDECICWLKKKTSQ
jgi:hypothetical protein